MKDKINVLIIGNGHYSTGSTVLEGIKETDKDFGVILPSILELKKQGKIDNIFLAAKNGIKFIKLREKLELMGKKFNWDINVKLFPNDDKQNNYAYLDAIKLLPKPGAVIIATPDHLHKEMIINSIKYDHHFLVVKPVVTKLKDLEEILIKLQNTKILGLVDYHKVFDDANIILKNDIEQNKFGQIQHIFSKMTQRRDMLEIFGKRLGKGTNVNHYLGSHYIHLVGFITKANPINVRATCQYGIAKKDYGIETPDLIETQIVWEKNGKQFTSYHIAGWADPDDTSSMTYQEIHIIGTKGHIESDQKFRGFETTILNEGYETVNPYFFNLNLGLDGQVYLEGNYGFKSIKTFIESILKIENGVNLELFKNFLPTIEESNKVTAILEAADVSLMNNSSIVELNKL